MENTLKHPLDKKIEDISNNLRSKIKKLKTPIAHISRFIIYFIVGYFIYYFLEPPKVLDIPLSQVSLSDILKNIAVIISEIYLVWKFFQFPKKEDEFGYGENYKIDLWALAGFILVIIIVVYFIVLNHESNQTKNLQYQTSPAVQEIKNKYNLDY